MSPMSWLLRNLLPPGLCIHWCWGDLTKAERDQASRAAAVWAKQVYGKELTELTPEQLRRVRDMVQAHFAA
jgi:hypothetical protein